jgi:hypothetical protein
MNSKQKKILLTITLLVVWITTAPSTTVATPENKKTETPAVLLQRERLYLTTTTEAMRKHPQFPTPQIIRRPRQIPRTVNYHPTTTTTTAPISAVELSIEKIICAKPWNCEEALQVAYCESRLNPGAISPTNSNGTRDWGLMQINDVWRQAFPVRWAKVLDAKTNVDMAWHIYQTAGKSWQPWTCRP